MAETQRTDIGSKGVRLDRSTSLGILGLLGMALLWELVARAIDRDIFLVPFTRVAADLWTWTSSGEIVDHLVASGTEFVVGFGLAAVVGVALGIVMGLSGTVKGLTGPLVAGLYSTPLIALTPLFVIWLGFGLPSKVALIFLVAVFPVLINAETGIRQADQTYVDAVRSFGASGLQIVRKVRFPAALPFIFAGMRISVARATVGIFVAEIFGARAGIGYTIINAAASFDTARLLSGILVLAVFGVVVAALVERIGAWAAPWRATQGTAK